MSFRGLVNAHVIGGGGGDSRCGKGSDRESIHGPTARLAARYVSPERRSAKGGRSELGRGWSEERRLAREPGIKGGREAAGLRPPRALKLQHSDREGPNRFRRHPAALQGRVCHAGGRPRWSFGCDRGKAPAEQ